MAVLDTVEEAPARIDFEADSPGIDFEPDPPQVPSLLSPSMLKGAFEEGIKPAIGVGVRQLDRAGRFLAALGTDIKEMVLGRHGHLPTEPEPFRNTSAFSDDPDSPLPIQEEVEQKRGVNRFMGKALLGLAEMEPKLATSILAGGGVGSLIGGTGRLALAGRTLATGATAALPFSIDEEGNLDVKNAAILTALPAVSQLGGKLTTRLVQRYPGISSESAKRVVEGAGGLLAANAYLLATQTPEILKLPPEEREQAVLDLMAVNLGPSLLGLVGLVGSRTERTVAALEQTKEVAPLTANELARTIEKPQGAQAEGPRSPSEPVEGAQIAPPPIKTPQIESQAGKVAEVKPVETGKIDFVPDEPVPASRDELDPIALARQTKAQAEQPPEGTTTVPPAETAPARGELIEPQRRTEVQLPEEFEGRLYDNALEYAERHFPQNPDEAASFIYSRLLNRAREFYGERGTDEGFAAQSLIDQQGASFHRRMSAEKRGGGLAPESLEAEGEAGPLRERMQDESAKSPAGEAALEEAKAVIERATANLQPFERRVLQGLEAGETDSAVAKSLGISQADYSSIKSGVLAKMVDRLAKLGVERSEDVLPTIQRIAMPTTAQQTTDAKPVSRPQIIEALERTIQAAGGRAPIRTGRFLQRALGVFKRFSEVIRLRTASDVTVATHEVGHALQKAIYQSAKSSALRGLPPAVKNELVALGRALYGSRLPAAGYAAEGLAEYMRLRLTTDTVQQSAPQTHQYFETNVLPGKPKVAAALAETKALIDTYRKQGAVLRAKMTLDKGESALTRTAKVVRDFLSKKAQVDEFEPLRELSLAFKEVTGQQLSPGEDPFLLASWKRGTAGATVEQMAERGMVDPKGNVVGPSLQEALAPVKGRKEDFTLYLFGRRAVERWGKGRNPGIELSDAEFLVRHFDSPEFQVAAQKVYDWQRGVLEYVAEANPTVAPVIQAILRSSQDYVPLARVIDPAEATAAAVAAKANPLYRMEGSGRQVKDIFPVMLENAARLVSQSNKRLVLDSIIRLSRVEGMGNMVEEVPRDRVPTTFNFENVRRQLEDMGVDTSAINPDQLVTFFGPALYPKGVDPIVPYKDVSGTRWFAVNPDLFGLLNGLDQYRLPKILDIFLGMPTRAFRLGTTGLRASFSLVTNPLRDVQTFIAQTKSESNPAKLASAYFSSLLDVVRSGVGGKSSPFTELFYQLGAHMGQPLGTDINYTKAAAKRLFKGKTFAVVTNPIDHLRELFSITESAPRVAELKLLAEEVGWTPGTAMTMDQAVQMGLGAKRVTVDFTAAGNVAKVLNQAVPFYNPSIQGTRSFLRAFKENPARATLVGLTAVTVPTLTLWWQNRDKDWYRNLPWREKYLYWNVQDGDNVWQIPRAFEWGNAFAVIPEALLDSWFEQDPEGATQALKHILATSNPADLPVPLKIAKEQWQNRIDFFDRPIVPRGQTDLPPGEQVGPYTSKLATWLGEAFPESLSPRRIDAGIRSYFGGAVPDLLDALGLGATSKDREFEPSDVPVLGRLFRRGGTDTAASQALADYWDEYQRYSALSRSKQNPLKGEQLAYWNKLKAGHAIIKAALDVANRTSELKARQVLYRRASEAAEQALQSRPKD